MILAFDKVWMVYWQYPGFTQRSCYYESKQTGISKEHSGFHKSEMHNPRCIGNNLVIKVYILSDNQKDDHYCNDSHVPAGFNRQQHKERYSPVQDYLEPEEYFPSILPAIIIINGFFRYIS